MEFRNNMENNGSNIYLSVWNLFSGIKKNKQPSLKTNVHLIIKETGKVPNINGKKEQGHNIQN